MANHLPPNKHEINQNYKQYSLRDSVAETAEKKTIMNHASEILTKYLQQSMEIMSKKYFDSMPSHLSHQSDHLEAGSWST